MTSLLNMLDKKPFQAFTIEHGIERIKIKIPLKEVRTFEKTFALAIAEGADTKNELLQLVHACGGSVRETK
jgi:hypothetical protein